MSTLLFNQSGALRIIWRMLLFIIIAFGVNIPMQIALRNVLDQGILRGFLSSSIFLLSVLVAYRIEVKRFGQSTFAAYGFNMDKRWWTQFGIGLIIPAMQLGLFLVIMQTMGYVDVVGYIAVSEYTFTQGFISEVWSHVVTGVSEEVIHRSVLFYLAFEGARRLGKSTKVAAVFACVFSSLIFGLGHSGNDAASVFSTLNLWMDAIILCLPLLITGNIAMPIAMHFSWNLVQGAILGFPVSGYPAKVSVLQLHIENNSWTGGAFGPEASVLLVGLNLLSIAAILMYKRAAGYKHWINISSPQGRGVDISVARKVG